MGDNLDQSGIRVLEPQGGRRMIADDFETIIEVYASKYQWEVVELDGEMAELAIETRLGDYMPVILEVFGAGLWISLSSDAEFDDLEEVPHQLSTELLVRNSKIPLGAWSLIEDDNDGWVYTLAHSLVVASRDFAKDIPGSVLKDVVDTLVDECMSFNLLWEQEG